MAKLITVSAGTRPLRRKNDMAQAKQSEKAAIDGSGRANPKSAPMATPVSAACPMASEKKAIRLFTTRHPGSAKSGASSNEASSALRINP
jgi:hypothetical protein